MGPKLNFLIYKTAVCGEISAAAIVHETGKRPQNQLHEGECEKHLCVIQFPLVWAYLPQTKKCFASI